MKTRLTLSKDELLQDVRDARQRAIERRQEDVVRYPELLEKWQHECKSTLEKALAKVAKGEAPGSYSSVSIPLKPKKPESVKSYTCRFDRAIDYINRSANDAIRIPIDEYNSLTGKDRC